MKSMKSKKLKIYSYKNCDTCRKALKFLAAHKFTALEEVDITVQAPSMAELRSMLAQYEGDFRKLFNTSGLVYKEMGLSAKIKTMSSADALKLLAANGRLVKRPFLLVDGEASQVGFKEAEWLQALS